MFKLWKQSKTRHNSIKSGSFTQASRAESTTTEKHGIKKNFGESL